MSEEPYTVEKNFRSSYYKSLGFRGEEENLSQLEGLIKADPIDCEQLKVFCLKHSLASCYRSLVWKVLTGVSPVYTESDTCSFVRDQKHQQYRDLNYALCVMGRIEQPNSQRSKSSISQPPTTSTPLQSSQLSSALRFPHAVPSHSPSKQSQVTSSREFSSSPSVARSKSECFGEGLKKCHQSHDPSAMPSGSVASSSVLSLTPEHMVLMYLLENNRLLLSSVNQMKLEPQVNLSAIAKVILELFEESECDRYWLFSGFAKLWEINLAHHTDKMRESVARTLKEVDSVLYSHLRDTNAFEEGVPYEKWFGQCFASDLSHFFLKSVWDKVVAGSTMVVAFVAVAILLSAKKQLLSVQMVRDIRRQLESIPKETHPLIIHQALELWESSASPLEPVMTS